MTMFPFVHHHGTSHSQCYGQSQLCELPWVGSFDPSVLPLGPWPTHAPAGPARKPRQTGTFDPVSG